MKCHSSRYFNELTTRVFNKEIMNKIFFLLFSSFSVSLFAQQDPEAQKILDAFSKKTKSYKAYSADFEVVSENKQTGESSENKGSIVIMDEKYKIKLNQVEMYFDGKDIYNYSPKSNEVSITKAGKGDDDAFLKNPSKLFNLYTKDYKYRLLGEVNYMNKTCYEIDLYPNDFKKKYSIVKLLIEKDALELVAAKLQMKSGVNYTLNISKFNSKIQAKESDFTFNPSTYKDIEVIDLR